MPDIDQGQRRRPLQAPGGASAWTVGHDIFVPSPAPSSPIRLGGSGGGGFGLGLGGPTPPDDARRMTMKPASTGLDRTPTPALPPPPERRGGAGDRGGRRGHVPPGGLPSVDPWSPPASEPGSPRGCGRRARQPPGGNATLRLDGAGTVPGPFQRKAALQPTGGLATLSLDGAGPGPRPHRPVHVPPGGRSAFEVGWTARLVPSPLPLRTPLASPASTLVLGFGDDAAAPWLDAHDGSGGSGSGGGIGGHGHGHGATGAPSSITGHRRRPCGQSHQISQWGFGHEDATGWGHGGGSPPPGSRKMFHTGATALRDRAWDPALEGPAAPVAATTPTAAAAAEADARLPLQGHLPTVMRSQIAFGDDGGDVEMPGAASPRRRGQGGRRRVPPPPGSASVFQLG